MALLLARKMTPPYAHRQRKSVGAATPTACSHPHGTCNLNGCGSGLPGLVLVHQVPRSTNAQPHRSIDFRLDATRVNAGSVRGIAASSGTHPLLYARECGHR